MAYTKSSSQSKTVATRGTRGLETTDSAGVSESTGEFYELEVAEVISVILDSEHPDYISKRDIGKVKFRFVNSQRNKPKDELYLAKPWDANIQKYPLQHEAVVVGNYLGEYYYMDVLPTRQDVNQNSAAKISETVGGGGDSGQTQSQTYQEAGAGLGNSQSSESEPSLGDTFEASTEPKPLKPDEGDILIQGRFGNTVRFGSNTENGTPTMFLACGQSQENKDKEQRTRVRENINEDAASLYMTEDKVIELTPTTEDADAHNRSVEEAPSEYGGKQAIMKSDRLVFDSRARHFSYAAEGFHVTSGKNVTTDAEKSILRTAKENLEDLAEADIIVEAQGNEERTVEGNRTIEVSGNEEESISGNFTQEVGGQTVFDSPQIFIGSGSASEPLVLGNKFVTLFNSLLTYLDSHTHPTPVGPTGPPAPPASPSVQPNVQPSLSQTNFTE